jgi:Molybdopterin cofactor-binding domain
MLEHHPRHKAVLELAANAAGWGSPLPKGKGRGIAVAEAFGTYVAQVAEVTVAQNGQIKVDRVVCAVDCGTPINPDVITAQMEGGIGFGLGAALYGAITLKDGNVEQTNFDTAHRRDAEGRGAYRTITRGPDRRRRTGRRAGRPRRRQRRLRGDRQTAARASLCRRRHGLRRGLWRSRARGGAVLSS